MKLHTVLPHRNSIFRKQVFTFSKKKKRIETLSSVFWLILLRTASKDPHWGHVSCVQHQCNTICNRWRLWDKNTRKMYLDTEDHTLVNEFINQGLIDWLIGVSAVSAIFQPNNFEVSLAALTSLIVFEIQWNGHLRAKGFVILDTGRHWTSHPTAISWGSGVSAKLVRWKY